MSIASDVFNRSRPDYRRMEAFGFDRQGACFCYAENLPGGQFRAELTVTEDGAVRGRVVDLETEEEYLPIRFANQVGGFVGNVREAYRAFLEHVRQQCFVPVSFICDQSNRIEAQIHRVYDVTAEFPWEKYPGNGTFKCKGNGKWFAAILTVAFGKLTGGAEHAGSRPHDEEEIVEAINLKADPDEIPRLTERPGIFPAWHMNKKHWISVLLDGTLSDAQVMELVEQSRRLASGGSAKKAAASGAWMIPSNPAVYDVDAGFRGGRGVIEWHQHNNIKAGDEVFIYCSAPYSALIYHCEVVAADLPYKGMFQKQKGYTRAMRIRLIEKYPPDRFDLAFIKAHGGSVVRSARTMPETLYRAIRDYK